MNPQLKQYTIPPPEFLSDFIRSYWVVEGSVSESSPLVHRTLADVRPQLIFYYAGRMNIYVAPSAVDGTFTAGVYGQTDQFRRFTTGRDFGMFGIDFYPYAFPALFALPASDLTNQRVDLKTLLGTEGRILEDAVVSSSTNLERAKIASNFFLKRLSGARQLSPHLLRLLKRTMDHPGPFSPRDLSVDSFLSRRQFERKLRELCGFGPKSWLNVLRFQAALRNRSAGRSLTQVAYECGFYDQSHFIRDFKRFSGYNPGEFFRHVTDVSGYKTSPDFKQ